MNLLLITTTLTHKFVCFGSHCSISRTDFRSQRDVTMHGCHRCGSTGRPLISAHDSLALLWHLDRLPGPPCCPVLLTADDCHRRRRIYLWNKM